MKSIFLIPGFLGGKKEVKPVLDYLSKRGFFIYVPIIKGHGTEDKISPYKDWIYTIRNEFEKFQENNQEIYIIGFSMGGVLATSLFYKPNYKIKGLVLISSAFIHIYFNSISKYSIKEIRKDAIRKINLNIIYGARQLKLLSEEAKKNNWLSMVNRKTFVAQGDKDGMVKKENIYYVFNNLNCEKQMKIYKGKHYLLNNEELLEDVYNFIGGNYENS